MKKESVLITGSSKGLGAQLALVFASNGHDLIIHGRNVNDLSEVCKKVLSTGVLCCEVEGDLSEESTLDALCKLGKDNNVSVLINNAGTDLSPEYAGIEQKQPLSEIEDWQIDDILITNLSAPIKLTKRFYKLFLKKGNGTIININSLSGLKSHRHRSVYCASKWGLKGFADSLRLETVNNKVRILGIYPGRINTRAHFTYGMDAKKVAQKIYAAYENTGVNELVIDERPE